ncbi:MAG TPA: DHH family phosphoesterase [Kiritimatiellia bacterium]|nr:DHH family phosphoesterase [Kiritimatiellia bacterium]HMO99140.1 DHH family phosphoesterase [Kiritimatiellia bacterium]HMP95682.1 DHH family phosphoesterase [Kiritimatiellia bacterium]
MTAPSTLTTEKRLEQLASILPHKRKIYILPHDYPDPDALASAAAMHLLLDKKFGIHSQIAFNGTVSRAENKELLRRLRYKWVRTSTIVPPSRPACCILVDTAPWSTNITIPSFARPIAVVDHHRHARDHVVKDLYTDIRSGAGATTTIMHEYLKAAGIVPPRWLAAIMAYAISSETLDLSREYEKADVDAYIDLAARADLKIVGKIRHAPLPRSYYALLQEALTNARKYDKVAWSHLSGIEQPEIVAEVADLLLRMDGIRWSFCTANVNDGLFVSLRSCQPGARCSQLLRGVISRKGSSGGHDSMAAGFMDHSSLSDVERSERRQSIVASILGRIFKKTPVDFERIEQLSLPKRS